MFRRSTIFLAVLSFVFCDVAFASAEVLYTVTDLGDGFANGINASGHVVGTNYSIRSGGNGCAYLYSSGSTLDLGAPTGTYSSAHAINDNGQVVGYYFNTSGNDNGSQPFLWQSDSGMQTLPVPIPKLGGQANGINDNGQAVGWAYFNPSGYENDLHAFLYSGGLIHDLNLPISPSTDSWANAINNCGQIVGAYGSSGSHAFSWQSGSGMQDIGTLSGMTYSVANAVNDSGQVVGESDNGGPQHAFLWQSGSGIQDIGDGIANGINDNGWVVGGNYHGAFLWKSDVGMENLNALIGPSSGWVLEEAYGINDNGWIVGNGTTGGHEHAFLLMPNTVPEPSTLVLLGIGAAAMLAWGRWRWGV